MKFIVLISFVLLLICFWNRNDLAENMQLTNELEYEPEQKKIDQPAFSVTVNSALIFDLFKTVLKYPGLACSFL